MAMEVRLRRDLDRAKAALTAGGHTCVLCMDDSMLVSADRGISPILDWMEAERDIGGYCAADKVVGKAAALLFALAGIAAVYGETMSTSAMAALERCGIPYEYSNSAAFIINRAGTGPCPMELSVAGIDDPALAKEAILKARHRLRIGEGSRA